MLQKSDFYLRPDVHFLNHGSFGSCPKELMAVQLKWQERLEQQPVLFHRELPELLQSARKKLGAYINADFEDIVFVTNSTYAVNAALNAARTWFEPGSEIVTTNHEYGACLRAVHHHLGNNGVKVVEANIAIPFPPQEEVLDAIWRHVTPNTRMLFFSHIGSTTASVFPVQELCKRARERGIVTLVDGAHSAGQIPIDMEAIGADIYTSNCHKWMCTPKGSAFMYVRRELHDKFSQLIMSWGISMVSPDSRALVTEHEYVGTRDPSPFLTVPAAIDWMERNNWPEVQQRSWDVVQYALQRLTQLNDVRLLNPNSPPLHMGAVILPKGTDPVQLKERLYDRFAVEVVVLPFEEHTVLRVSAHAHTTNADVDALIKGLNACL